MGVDGPLKKEKSLKGRLIRIFFICVGCLILLSVLAFTTLYRTAMNNMAIMNVQLNQVAAQNVEYAINEQAKEYLDFFVSSSTSRVLNRIISANDQSTQYQNIYNDWKNSIATNASWMPAFVHSIAVIDLNGEFHTWGRSIHADTKEYLLETISNNGIADTGEIQYLFAGEPGSEYLIAIRTLLNIETFDLEPIGYSISLLDFDTIVKDSYIKYIDIGNTTVCGYLGEQLIYAYPHQEDNTFALAQSNSVIQEIEDETYLLSETFIQGTDIRLSTYQNISSAQQVLSIIFAAILIIVFIGGAVIVLYNNYYITRLLSRLEILTKTINSIFQDNVYHSDIQIDLAPFSEPYVDELTTVAKAYKEVYDKTNELITENLVRKLLFQEQQFVFLQSQINPHFLYNTLDTIKVLSRNPEKSDTVSDLVTSLASIMRYSLSKNMLSHVGEEMEIVRQYIVIQRTRFANRLMFSAVIEYGCEDIELPKMILQPLIENSIQYSVERKGTVSNIRLRIYTMEKKLCIVIIDTGIGLPLNVLKNLQKREFDVLPGHGLKNVMIRLDNIFKERFSVKVRTKEGRYTAIKISILNQTEFRNTDLTS